MEHNSTCVACEYYGVVPASLSVDPACQSKDEVDALCMIHRARGTEGYCILCGRREPWASLWPRSDIGCCELCFRVTFGNEAGDQAAEQLEWYRELA